MGGLASRAAEWEAKYRALVHRMEPKHVEAAEKLVRKSFEVAAATRGSPQEVIQMMVWTAEKLKVMEEKNDGE